MGSGVVGGFSTGLRSRMAVKVLAGYRVSHFCPIVGIIGLGNKADF